MPLTKRGEKADQSKGQNLKLIKDISVPVKNLRPRLFNEFCRMKHYVGCDV